jgi:ribosome-binding protein aMBF1 (putative translation factor)
MANTATPSFVNIAGTEYVVLPKADYLRLVRMSPAAPLKDAREAVRAVLGARLREARRQAGLSQRELAERLGISQPMVAAVERGRARVGSDYTKRLLRACRLPPDWDCLE